MGPLPMMRGRMYREPLPWGGTQFAFASTQALMASTKMSVGTGGMHKRSQPYCVRREFLSGLRGSRTSATHSCCAR